jgi:hypothetical protein
MTYLREVQLDFGLRFGAVGSQVSKSRPGATGFMPGTGYFTDLLLVLVLVFAGAEH